MLFTHMPVWLVILILIFSLLVKHFTAERFQLSYYYQDLVRHKRWGGVVTLTAIVSALTTLLIFLSFTDLYWATNFAAIDFALFWLDGLYKSKRGFPYITRGQLITGNNIIRTIHLVSYIGFIFYTVSYVHY